MLTKRPGSPYWQIEFTLRGVTVRRSSGTTDKRLAEKAEQKLRDGIWKQSELGEGPIATWERALEEWISRKVKPGKPRRRDVDILNQATTVFAGKKLTDIDQAELTKYGAVIAKHTSEQTANRHLAAIRGLLRLCVKVKLLKFAPAVEMYETHDYEPTWITQEQFATLLRELPPHAVPIVIFAVETGLRLSNITKARWVPATFPRKFEPYVEADGSCFYAPSMSTKAKRPITIPLSTIAWDTIRDMERSKTGYIFVDNRLRAPIRSIKTCWKQACIRAGVPGLRFHDLRHTWASWQAQAKVPESIIQQLGGWADARMVKRYSHLNVEHLREYVK